MKYGGRICAQIKSIVIPNRMGWCCVLSPSSFIKARFGLKSRLEEYSESLEEALEEVCRRSEPILLILPIGNDLFFQRIYGRFEKRAPFLNPHFLNNDMLMCHTQFSFHPGKILHRWRLNKNFAKWLSKLQHVALPQHKYYHELERKYGWQVSFFAAGFNPNEFPRNVSKVEARATLQLNKDDYILLCSSRIVPEKQIDKLITVLSDLKDFPWKCYITGNGPDSYITVIEQMIRSLKLNNRVSLVGYVSDELLRYYYQSADLFFMTSLNEAGPGSANLAAWYGLPVISTRTGSVAELLEQEGVGYLVDPENYEEWKKALRFAFNRNIIKTLDEKVLVYWKGRKNNIERLVSAISDAIQPFYN